MKYFKLEQKINEIKHFAKNGLIDVKSTGLECLDGYIGLKKGYPLYIAGDAGSGKTEFLLEILVNTSILYGWKHFIYSGEGGNVEHIYTDILSKYLQKPYDWADEKDKLQAEYFISEHFIIANHDKEFSLSDFYLTIKEAESELNIKFDTVSFDPYNDMVEKLGDHDGREDKHLSSVLKSVRVSSKENNRIEILVTHIASIRVVTVKDTEHRYSPPAEPSEWAGGKTWHRRGFTMVVIWRPPIFLKDLNGMPYAENETHVIIQKAKPKGVSKKGTKSIFFDWKKNRFYCFKEGQQLYSCETLETFKANTFKPNIDFTTGINKLNDEGSVF